MKQHTRTKIQDVPKDKNARFYTRWNNTEDHIILDLLHRQPDSDLTTIRRKAYRELKENGFNRTECAVEARIKLLRK